MKLRLAILAALLIATNADAQAKKDVIPHAQDRPPGPALSPQEALKRMQVPPGFHVELIAAEPDIVNPVAMTFDERGRIWITESIEYPRRSAGPGKDRVKLLESTKGDGKFDKITTVIDGLNIPSGIAIGHGGVWVANAPDILFYPFVDFATAKLATPQVVVTGFGRYDTHELPNSLMWGPDGWLYGLNGVFNRSVIKQDGKTFDFTCALFRIHPKTKKFEIFCEGTSNPWGLAFNENGDAFVSACVIDHLWHLTETGYYQRQGGPYPPFTWKIGSIVKHRHQKAAYCGLVWFDSDAYPPEYREKLYMGNIHGGCINCDQLAKDGSTYFATPGLLPSTPGKGAGAFLPSPPVLRGRGAGGEGDEVSTASSAFGRPMWTALPGASSPSPLTPLPLSTGGEGNQKNSAPRRVDGKAQGVGPGGDFLVANDAWFMPVAQKVGPDGCMYILDWYDRYHCYQDANRDPAGIDRLHGRLYRVVYKDYKPAGKFDLGREPDQELFKRLQSPNVFFRETAQRALAERHADFKSAKKIPDWSETLEGLSVGRDNRGRSNMHALWAMLGMGYIYPDFHGCLLDHKDPVLRAWAVRTAGSFAQQDPDFSSLFAKWVLPLAKDPAPEVQLQVAIAARKLKGVDPLPILFDVLTHCGDDKLIPHIVWQNLHPLLEKDGERFLSLAAKADLTKAPGLAKLLPHAIDRILGNASGDPAAVVAFADKVFAKKEEFPRAQQSDETARLCLTALILKIQNNEIPGKQLDALRPKIKPTMEKMLRHPHSSLQVEATILLALVKDAEGIVRARKMLGDAECSEESRLGVMTALIAAGDGKQVLSIGEPFLQDKRLSATFRGQFISTLGPLDDPNVAVLVLRSYATLEPELQPKAIELLTQRPAWAKSLFKEIAAKKIGKDVVNVNQARRLLATKDKELATLIEKHWGTPRDSRSPERERVAAQMKELYTKTPSDPKAGVAVFKKLCAQCHKIYGEGVEVGPDLTSNGRADFNQLLSNIFDPSLVIGAGYQAVVVNTKQGQVVTGLLVEDNPQRVVLKVQGGELKTIARADVDEQFTSKLSMMPEDLEKQLRPQEIVDLLAYLSLDRPPDDVKARKIPGTPR